jgi:hypothetical protein
VFKEVPRDLWKFVSWDTAIVVGAGGGAALVGHIWDDDLADQVETSTTFNNAMEPAHTYGAFSFQFAIGLGVYGTGWLADKGRLAQVGGDIMRAQLVGQAYAQALKFTVGGAAGRLEQRVVSVRPFGQRLCDRDRAAAALRLAGGCARHRRGGVCRDGACARQQALSERRDLRWGAWHRRPTHGHAPRRPLRICAQRRSLRGGGGFSVSVRPR